MASSQTKTSKTAGTKVPMKRGTSAKSQSRWVAQVKTDAVHPPEGLFTKDAATIARTLATKKVSPKGTASGLRMLTYFINRGGKGLDPERRKTLERAKDLLSKRIKSVKTPTKAATIS